MSAGPRYIPIDELLQRPDIRALRALRWFDWVTAEEIGDTLGLPPPDESPQRNTLVAAITRLVNRGEIQRRPAPHGSHGARFEYRITAKGRARVERRLQVGAA
jgi:DNA-binding MarR family transcriptional regulator